MSDGSRYLRNDPKLWAWAMGTERGRQPDPKHGARYGVSWGEPGFSRAFYDTIYKEIDDESDFET